MRIIPPIWHAFDYPPLVWIAFAILGGAAFAGVLTMIAKQLGRPATLLRVCTLTTFFAVLTAHVFTTWILAVDPYRTTGTVPLPAPLGEIALTLSPLLALWMPLYLGVVLAATISTRKVPFSMRLLATSAMVAVYTVWVTPWSVYVVFD